MSYAYAARRGYSELNPARSTTVARFKSHVAGREFVTINTVFLKRLRLLGICEGISTLVLFGGAMPLKYFGGLPMAVTIVGSLHGFLFVCLVAMFLLAVRRVPISVGLALSGIVAAFFPFGPFIVDRRLARVEGSLAEP